MDTWAVGLTFDRLWLEEVVLHQLYVFGLLDEARESRGKVLADESPFHIWEASMERCKIMAFATSHIDQKWLVATGLQLAPELLSGGKDLEPLWLLRIASSFHVIVENLLPAGILRKHAKHRIAERVLDGTALARILRELHKFALLDQLRYHLRGLEAEMVKMVEAAGDCRQGEEACSVVGSVVTMLDFVADSVVGHESHIPHDEQRICARLLFQIRRCDWATRLAECVQNAILKSEPGRSCRHKLPSQAHHRLIRALCCQLQLMDLVQKLCMLSLVLSIVGLGRSLHLVDEFQ